MSKAPVIEPLEEIIAKLKKQAEQEEQQKARKKSPEERQKNKRPPSQKLAVTDMEILKKHHKFLREDEDQKPNYRPNKHEYGQLLARKYYSKLYKQFAIVDLEHYIDGRIGCRWRTEKQVLSSKGEALCGNKRCSNSGRETYQFNFAYQEDGQRKNALVKVRLCLECVPKLNYKKQHVKIEEQ